MDSQSHHLPIQDFSIQKVCEKAFMEQIRFNEFSGDLQISVCYITGFDD